MKRRAASNGGKKPNFLLIVIASSVFLVLFLIAAVYFVHWDGTHLMLKPMHAPASETQFALPSRLSRRFA